MDLPLQHVSDRILAQMGRKVDRAAIERLLWRLRDAMPDMTLRTTFIVGFPGETESEFEELLGAVREIRFDHVGAFAYSPEAGTRAAELPDRVAPDVVADRLERLLAAQTAIVAEKNRALVGRVVEVLIDGESESPRTSVGRTAAQAPDVDPVTFVHGRHAPGSFLRAEITGSVDPDLTATPVR